MIFPAAIAAQKFGEELSYKEKFYFDFFLHLRSIVQPTAFRKSENYVIYYHSWTWTIVTGIWKLLLFENF